MKPKQRTIPTISPTKNEAVTISPERSQPVRYDKPSTDRLLTYVTTKTPQSDEDTQVKETLLKSIGYQSAVVNNTSSYRIEYIRSADQFMVEIKDINVGKAKQDVVIWFSSKGFSQHAICTMPVVFYLNSVTAQELEPLHISFSQLADGC